MNPSGVIVSNAQIAPAKLALIGGLAVVLVVVVAWQLPAWRAMVDPAAAVSLANTALPVATRAVAVKPRAPLPEWPTVDVDHVVRHNPFRLSGYGKLTEQPTPLASQQSSPEKTPAVMPPSAAKLLKERVQWVVVHQDNAIARIGERTVQVGDVIEGYRVAAITQQGVVLVEVRP